MAVTRTEPGSRRVSVQLDCAMLVEALIVQRLDALPRRRHRDWIRSLLVQGYLGECRVLRRLDGATSTKPVTERKPPSLSGSGFDFGHWVYRSANARPAVRAHRAAAEPGPHHAVHPGGNDKPFAHLRKVVG